jgi:hypothetical protein
MDKRRERDAALMGRFAGLLEANIGLPPGEQQRLASERFASVAGKSHMKIWQPGETFPRNGVRLLIGVATYSVPELEMLDNLEAQLSRLRTGHEIVHLFNVLDCAKAEDFERYVPGIGKVYQTPVLGLWEDGVLKERAQGKAARDLVTQRYSLPS